jgi:hypothetical protein
MCVVNCSVTRVQYADDSTNRCVDICPIVPSLYGQDNGMLCVSSC